MNVSENRWLSARETAERWKISERRVRMLCSEGKVIGAVREGKVWRIPSDCSHPADGRTLRGAGIPKELTALVFQIDGLKAEWEGYPSAHAWREGEAARDIHGGVTPIIRIFAEAESARLTDAIAAVRQDA